MVKQTINQTDNTQPKYIYEPLDEYAKLFKDTHNKNAINLFDELFAKSGVNATDNKKAITEIQQLDIKKDKSLREKKRYKVQKVLLILFIIVSVITLGMGLYLTIDSLSFVIYQFLMILLGSIFLTLAIILLVKVVNPHIKRVVKEILILKENIKMKIHAAYDQIKPLNNLFYDGMSAELMCKTTPIIKIDPMFNSKRHDYLVGKFGYSIQDDSNRSSLFVKSGEINGNPFFICRDLIHQLKTKRYNGSITITWTTQQRVNNQLVTQHHSQVLTASVSKPCPYYHIHPYVIFGNEAASDLIFHRHKSEVQKMSEKQIERMVNRDIRKLNRKAEKSIVKGTTFTVMANAEFEVLFDARNRNHETQFRLLFTPLAQKQLLHLMKDNTIGFGDNFDFIKTKMINVIVPEHLIDVNLNDSAELFSGYDLEKMRKTFIDYNNIFFKNFYFALAPLLAIPLYQQQKPLEYIYKDLYDSYLSFYEHERVANTINQTEFVHPLSSTRNVLKTSVIKSSSFCDTVQVNSYGYQTINRTDYISKPGRDGRMHMVPVHWVEYIPVNKKTIFDVHIVPEEKEKTHHDKIKELIDQLRSDNEDKNKKSLFIINGLIACIHSK